MYVLPCISLYNMGSSFLKPMLENEKLAIEAASVEIEPSPCQMDRNQGK